MRFSLPPLRRPSAAWQPCKSDPAIPTLRSPERRRGASWVWALRGGLAACGASARGKAGELAQLAQLAPARPSSPAPSPAPGGQPPLRYVVCLYPLFESKEERQKKYISFGQKKKKNCKLFHSPVYKGSFGKHQIKLFIQTRPSLLNGSCIDKACYSAVNFSQVPSRDHSWWLVINSNLI